MNSLVVLGIISIIIQFIIDRMKALLPEKGRQYVIPLLALAIGITLSASTKIALLGSLGVALSPIWIDYVITGIAFSGGSVVFNELLKLLMELRPSNNEV